MDEKKIRFLAAELAKGLKTEVDIHQLSRMLTKLTLELALLNKSDLGKSASRH